MLLSKVKSAISTARVIVQPLALEMRFNAPRAGGDSSKLEILRFCFSGFVVLIECMITRMQEQCKRNLYM